MSYKVYLCASVADMIRTQIGLPGLDPDPDSDSLKKIYFINEITGYSQVMYNFGCFAILLKTIQN
jgi:hypothetical protein